MLNIFLQSLLPLAARYKRLPFIFSTKPDTCKENKLVFSCYIQTCNETLLFARFVRVNHKTLQNCQVTFPQAKVLTKRKNKQNYAGVLGRLHAETALLSSRLHYFSDFI